MGKRTAIWLGTALVSGLAAGATAAISNTDPCLLTLTEARELGGSDTVQAGGHSTTCDYIGADATPRVTIALFDANAPEGQAALQRLSDVEKYAEKKSGRKRSWLAADQLEGWVLSGDVLASVSATGESSSKRRRKLELAIFRMTEKLR